MTGAAGATGVIGAVVVGRMVVVVVVEVEVVDEVDVVDDVEVLDELVVVAIWVVDVVVIVHVALMDARAKTGPEHDNLAFDGAAPAIEIAMVSPRCVVVTDSRASPTATPSLFDTVFTSSPSARVTANVLPPSARE
jgi:hypothetical protein